LPGQLGSGRVAEEADDQSAGCGRNMGGHGHIGAYASLLGLAAMMAGCTSTYVPGLPGGGEGGAAGNAQLRAVCAVPENEEEFVGQVLDLVNSARADEGLPPLVLDEVLSVVAGEYACEMIEGGFFAHESPLTKTEPGDRLMASGYVFWAMGENLAVGQSSADQVFDEWMASEQHRANILSDEWDEVGIAVRNGGSYGWYWVEEFADPLDGLGSEEMAAVPAGDAAAHVD
jgi:uncharacterized protein YkwD